MFWVWFPRNQLRRQYGRRNCWKKRKSSGPLTFSKITSRLPCDCKLLYGRREGLRQIITRSYTNFVDRTIFGVLSHRSQHLTGTVRASYDFYGCRAVFRRNKWLFWGSLNLRAALRLSQFKVSAWWPHGNRVMQCHCLCGHLIV